MYPYYLPDENGKPVFKETKNNAIIFVGANGAGKSKLGAWIEQQDMENVHRIGGQRSLVFQENIPLKSYSQAEGTVFYGNMSVNEMARLGKRMRWKDGKEYTTTLLTDFEDVLAALLALTNNENAEYIKECKFAEEAGREKPQTRLSPIDKLFSVWDSVFPHRQLRVEDSKFKTICTNEEDTVEYSSNQMSDGERAVLYLAAQVICIPEGKTLIIDEPELHLHPSIMNRLWIALEAIRQDCLFIYITHDTRFAAMHSHAEKYWVREYDGIKWTIEKIENEDLPEELLLNILGNRNSVLFVEGTSNSYDTKLYSLLYPDYYIIPCGSCSRVISQTKAFKNSPMLHHNEVYGIIDRDYRSDYEIESYKKDNIFVLDVAEVENLFIVEGIIRIVAENQVLNTDDVFEKVKSYVIHDRFGKQIEKQICQCVVARLKYKLSTTDIPNKSENEAKSCLDNLMESLDYDAVKREEEAKFREVLSSDDYAGVLKVFNDKSISSGIETILKLESKSYKDLILRLANGKKRQKILDALASYLPQEIPR